MLPGAVLAGRYEIVRFIARGGMGEVFEARDRVLETTIALKTLRAGVRATPLVLERFRRELLLARSLGHPNICRTFDFQVADGPAGVVPFLTMELLAGEPLSERLRRVGRLDSREALPLARQMAAAIEAAHAAGVVHRDLKPANVFLVPSAGGERVVITDFGLAMELGPSGAAMQRLTQEGIAVGTPAYMAPEQLLGAAAGPATDIYSLGLVLFEALAGRLPFVGGNDVELASRRLVDEPPRLDGLAPAVDPRLAAAVERCLARDVRHRFASSGEVLRALDPDASRTPLTRRRRRRLAQGTAAVVLLALAALGAGRLHRAGPSGGGDAARSVVALPCQVAGDTDSAFLADAVPSTLSTLLVKLPELEIRRPPTSLQVDAASADLRRLARAFRVERCVTCSITAGADSLFLVLQLVEPESGRMLWSEVYRGKADRYDELVRRGADDLAEALLPGSAGRRGGGLRTPASPGELALRRGRYHVDRHGKFRLEADYRAARAALDEALRLDPALAAAAAYRAVLETQIAADPAAIESWGRRAIELDRGSALGWFALASSATTRSDTAQSIAYGLEAVRADQGEPLGYYVLGNQCSTLCLEASRKAISLDPLYLEAYANVALSLLELGRPGEALAEAEELLRLEPQEIHGLVIRVLALLALGRREEAGARLPDAGPGSAPLAETAHLAVALAGPDPAAGRRAAARVRELFDTPNVAGDVAYTLGYEFPPLLVRSGEVELALWILQRMVQRGQAPYFDWLMLNPGLEPLRRRPEFPPLRARSRAEFERIVRAFAEARGRGELPGFLDRTLAELVPRLGLAWPPGFDSPASAD